MLEKAEEAAVLGGFVMVDTEKLTTSPVSIEFEKDANTALMVVWSVVVQVVVERFVPELQLRVADTPSSVGKVS